MTATDAQLEYDGILQALRKLGKPVTPDGEGKAHSFCPNHGDTRIALMVHRKDGGAIVHCLKAKGCTRDQVLATLGIGKEHTNGHSNGETPEPGRRLRATKVSDIRMTATRWLWGDGPHCWIPQGALVGLGGREGVGKSTWCADLAAKITRGELPGDSYGKPRGVIIVSTEDDWSATIKPRLVAAGADEELVFHVSAVEPDGLEGVLSLPGDLPELERIIRKHDVALVILDPLLTLISKKLDTHKDAEVRVALGPVTKLAHNTGVSLVGLVHVNKSTEGDLLNRIMASRALTGVPRAFLFCARYDPPGEDQENPDPSSVLNDLRAEFVFGQIKNNLAAKVAISLRYHMDTEVVGHDNDLGKDIRASKLHVDMQPIDKNVEDIVLEQEKAKKRVKSQRAKAEVWLVSFLAGKGEAPSQFVVKAGKDAGYSRDAIYAARREMEDRIEVINLPVVPRQTVWKLTPI